MAKKISKKAGVVFMVLSILGLIGCGALNQRQAKQIEDKLSGMYEGKTFEVLALGNRFGTATNDTVTAHVKEINSGVVFLVKMNTKGEIVANSYPGSAVISQLEELLNTNLKKEGIVADSLLDSFGGKDVSNLNPDTPLNEYLSNYAPEFFSGYLVLKESPNNTGIAFMNAFRKTYNEIQKTTLQANVWVIPKESYDEVIEKFSRLPKVDNSWFDDKDTLSFFQFYIEKDSVNIDEKGVNKLLQAGGK